MKPELKKLLLLNLPYLLFVYLFAKCGQAYRLAAGVDASAIEQRETERFHSL